MTHGEMTRSAALSMNHSRALVEAHRCLYCYDAPCTQACPVHINVPGFIKRLAEENLDGSNRLLIECNPLATVCGLVCPTLELCEGACVLSRMGQTPIRIGALQYFVASRFQVPEPVEENVSRGQVAIIGGGPSSIGCAVVLRRFGHRVDLFERATTLGGLVPQVIPSHRLPQQVIANDLARLEHAGITFHLGQDVKAKMAEQIVRDHDAVFLGIGMSGSKSISVPGIDLAGVIRALDFLQQARQSAVANSAPPTLGECVVVIGGGNVALDAAVVAKRAGAERVIVLYRRTMEEMPAWRSEFLEATALGVEFRWLSMITSIQGIDGKVRAVEVQLMRRTLTQSDGRRGVAPDSRSPCYDLPCDTVLLALGQSLDETLAAGLGVSLLPEGTLRVNPETYQTNDPKIFAAGEVVAGGSTVVASIAQGMATGRAIHLWLSS